MQPFQDDKDADRHVVRLELCHYRQDFAHKPGYYLRVSPLYIGETKYTSPDGHNMSWGFTGYRSDYIGWCVRIQLGPRYSFKFMERLAESANVIEFGDAMIEACIKKYNLTKI